MCSVTRTQDLQSQDAQTQAWLSRRVRMQKHNHGNTNTTDQGKETQQRKSAKNAEMCSVAVSTTIQNAHRRDANYKTQ